MTTRFLSSVIGIELRLFFREPIGVFFSLAFPLILLLMIGFSFGSQPIGNGFRAVDTYVPTLWAMVIANLSLMGMPTTLSEYRENGVFKRLWATPVPLGVHVVAHAFVQGLFFLLSAALVAAVSSVVFGLQAAGTALLAIPLVLLGMAAFLSFGFLLGGLFGTMRTTLAVGGSTFFVMLFASGAAIPRVMFPGWLQTVTEVVPLTHLVDPLTAVWQGKGLGDQTGSLVYLAVMAVVGIVAANRFFRWQT